jgi:hypothetical protein
VIDPAVEAVEDAAELGGVPFDRTDLFADHDHRLAEAANPETFLLWVVSTVMVSALSDA